MHVAPGEACEEQQHARRQADRNDAEDDQRFHGNNQPTASVAPPPVCTVAAYSMWSTRRGRVSVHFDDAWMVSGRMATTPPASARQSTVAASRTTLATCSSVNTPSRWLFGRTRSGPLVLVESS